MSSHYKRMSYEQPMNKSRTNINIAPTASKYPIVNSKSKSKGKINNSSLKPNQIKISNQPKLDNNRKQTSPIKTNSTSIDINHKSLQFNIDDNYESLVNKNSNLRQKLVEAQEIIHSLNLKNKMLIEQQEKEKEEIFQELNRIGKNYKIYAESHKKLLEQEKEQNSSKTEEKDHNYELIKLYQDNISLYLIDYMAMLHKTVQHLTTHKNTNSHLFVFEIKDTILDNLKKYKDIVDSFNFPKLYEQYQILFKDYDYYKSIRPKGNDKIKTSPKKQLEIRNEEDIYSQPKQEFISIRVLRDFSCNNKEFLKVKKNEIYNLKYIDQENQIACLYNNDRMGLIPLEYLELININN